MASNRAVDFDDILLALAKKISDGDMNTLGKELGFDDVAIERYVATNVRYQRVTCNGTLAMLRDWDKKQTKATEQAALKKALVNAGLDRLADEFFPIGGTGMPATRAPATATVEEAMAAAKAANYPTDARSLEAFGLGIDLKIDRTFDRLSKHMPAKKYTSLCTGLGIEFNEANNILLQFNNDYQRATRSCLAQWKTKTGGNMAELKTILLEIDAEDVAKYIE